jgi:hypothetical protein
VRDDRAGEVDRLAARPDEGNLGDDGHSGRYSLTRCSLTA